MQGGKTQFRRVPVPPHRLTPLREAWLKIFNPVVEHMKLQIRMNTKTRHVELRVSLYLQCPAALFLRSAPRISLARSFCCPLTKKISQ